MDASHPVEAKQFRVERRRFEQTALLLQGGGALGSYQAGDNITDVNADAKFDPLVPRHIGILFRHAALDFVGASDGIDHACELDASAVPGVLDDASAMISDFGIKKRLSKSFQLRQRAFFVDPY